ncbi:DUF1573 domain-containing protein [Flavobacterium sp.]
MMITSCKKETSDTENDTNSSKVETHSDKVVEESENIPAMQASSQRKFPVMTLAEKEFDFGTITQGDKVDHTFTFKNTGEADLIITNAQASCGCTVPDYPKDTPIKPGESGKIKVTFNSAGKSGETLKTITLFCNTESGNELLKIKTTINVPK